MCEDTPVSRLSRVTMLRRGWRIAVPRWRTEWWAATADVFSSFGEMKLFVSSLPPVMLSAPR
jgi:hypothetical protein